MDRPATNLYASNMPRPATDPIQTFHLFGEDSELPDVAHCETIEARSRLHDWTLAPHRHARLHQILLIEDGGGDALIETARHPLAPQGAVNLPPGCVHGFAFERGTQGFVVTIPAETMDQILPRAEGVAQLLARPAAFRADDDLAATIRRIHAAFEGREFARAQILRSWIGVLLGQTAQSLHRQQPARPKPESALLDRFLALVDLHFCDHWSVARYASELAVSATHLSRVARAATGRPASALIEERVIREARRRLIYTNLPISRIAYALGFDDPAYFSRTFRRATGQSPRAFRARSRH